APGILAWCVRGCLEWQKEGLDTPAEVIEATKKYRLEQDLIRRFLDECTLSQPSCRVKAGDLYARYKGWVESGNEYVATMTAFSLAIKELGYEKKASNGMWYLGLGLRHESDSTNDEPPF